MSYKTESKVWEDIPQYDFITKTWSSISFPTKEDFKIKILSLFKEPGKYNFDESSSMFNEQGNLFNKNGFYCSAPYMTKDFIKYWDDQKLKCRKGIFVVNGDKEFYISRDYYMWINFLPIFDKADKKYGFPYLWDSQYHMALYELLAELHYKHAAIVKKRQFGSSYFHMAKQLNLYWFESGAVLKIGASMKDYINEKGSWKFLNEYRNFLNEHTAWYRPNEPDKVLTWQQQIKVRIGGRDTYKGLKSAYSGMSFEKDPTNGVGGPCSIFFHEEAGIAPKMDTTFEYIRPALKSGNITTGIFIAAGSVGELDQCEPLKKMILHPGDNDIYGIETDLLDSSGKKGISALFIPEQWSMPPFIDKYGNSIIFNPTPSQAKDILANWVEKNLDMKDYDPNMGSLEFLQRQRVKEQKELTPEKFQLRISQAPTNIAEAFATREVSIFPPHLIAQQRQRIEDGEYPVEYLDLIRDKDGKLEAIKSNKSPIKEFPVGKKTVDKTGTICVYERPIENAAWGTYYASIDPIGEGKAEYINNKLYTPTGKKRIGDIKIGDKVIGSNGKAINVTGVFPQGKKELYRVTFNDNTSILVCKEHLWSLRQNGGERRDSHVLNIDDLLNEEKILEFKGIGFNKNKTYPINTYYKNKNGSLRWKLPIVEPIEFNKNQVPLDPYFLGLLLGDGGLSTRSIIYTSADQELIDYIVSILPEDITIKKIGKYNYRISTYKNRNSITGILRNLELQGKKSISKFIPEVYKVSSIENRLSLLQGLMDTDGYCGNHGAEYYSISETLANDVVELAQTLGGVATIRKKITNRKKLNGVSYIYVVRVNLPSQFNPFRLKRKADLYKKNYRFSRYIKDIKFEKIDEAVCISVDAEDSLYVTENCIVTHNTTTSDSLCSIIVYKNPIEVVKDDGNGNLINYVERDKIVAVWCGRFDDLKKTHQRLESIIEWYNAWTVVEVNVSLFIEYMISQRKQKYLVTKDQMLFMKDLTNSNTYQAYGWKNTGVFFKTHLISYAIQFLQEEMDIETDKEGTVKSIKYGVERIPDLMLLEEMSQYQPGLNVDRLVSFAALVAFATVQQSNKGMVKRVEVVNDELYSSSKMSKLIVSPFRHLGQSHSNSTANLGYKRSGFKNLR